jgi:hypothetical protein
VRAISALAVNEAMTFADLEALLSNGRNLSDTP